MAGNDLFSSTPPKEPESNLPEELKGKSVDEVYTILSQEHTKEMDTLKGEFSTQISDINTKLEGIKTVPTQPTRQAPPTQFQPPQPPQKVSIFEDEDGFMDQQFGQRIMPLANAITQNSRYMGRELFIQKHKEEYDKYGEEIEKLVDGFAPMVQADPRAYDTAYNFVMGTHAKDLVKEAGQQKGLEMAKNVVSMLTEALDISADDPRVSGVIAALGGVPEGVTPAEPQRSSLFQQKTGTRTEASQVIPRSEPGGERPSYRQPGVKTKLSADERRMMDIFGFESEEEYINMRNMNNDQFSTLQNMGGGR